eukprot:CAMPEP_0197525394 /NCGR_PEP_ID=MMETSP1318-20131121/11887_1 /TAXON_ID=552666 /ORGANISM="Partenskyella glossopodia, Strain RCC365" /LENGTH=261 /DNA_ID=CAMNT_0043078759 /DNA_START=73 /DNA_END=858 /DNA_ORIENTATION=-
MALPTRIFAFCTVVMASVLAVDGKAIQLRKAGFSQRLLSRTSGIRGVSSPHSGYPLSRKVKEGGVVPVARSLGGGLRKSVVVRSSESEDQDARRRDLRNQIPGIIGVVGGLVTLIDEAWVAAYGCPPAWIGPQAERWGCIVVLSTFFVSMCSQFLTGGLLADFIEDIDSTFVQSQAAVLLKISEILAYASILYSTGVTSMQVVRYGPRFDLQKVADKECVERKRNERFLKQFPDYLKDTIGRDEARASANSASKAAQKYLE